MIMIIMILVIITMMMIIIGGSRATSLSLSLTVTARVLSNSAITVITSSQSTIGGFRVRWRRTQARRS